MIRCNGSHKNGNPRSKKLSLENRAFCTTRAALLRCIRKYCGEVNPTALEALITLSDNHTAKPH